MSANRNRTRIYTHCRNCQHYSLSSSKFTFDIHTHTSPSRALPSYSHSGLWGNLRPKVFSLQTLKIGTALSKLIKLIFCFDQKSWSLFRNILMNQLVRGRIHLACKLFLEPVTQELNQSNISSDEIQKQNWTQCLKFSD